MFENQTLEDGDSNKDEGENGLPLASETRKSDTSELHVTDPVVWEAGATPPLLMEPSQAREPRLHRVKQPRDSRLCFPGTAETCRVSAAACPLPEACKG